MAPPSFAPRTEANARLTARVPKKLVSISRRPASSAFSASGEVPVEMPALLMSSVTSLQRSAAAAMSVVDVTSRCTGTTPSSSTRSGLRAPA